MPGDDTRQDVNHRDIQGHRVVQRLFEVVPEVGLSAGDPRQPALASPPHLRGAC